MFSDLMPCCRLSFVPMQLRAVLLCYSIPTFQEAVLRLFIALICSSPADIPFHWLAVVSVLLRRFLMPLEVPLFRTSLT